MKIPTDAKDIGTIREFLQTVRTQVCGLADYLSEPWKTHFTDLKKHYDEALSALPPTDAVPAAMDASRHLSAFYSCLANANALASMLGSAMDSMVKKNSETVATALASAVGSELEKQIAAGTLFKAEVLPVKVTEAITARTAAGEFVPKDRWASRYGCRKIGRSMGRVRRPGGPDVEGRGPAGSEPGDDEHQAVGDGVLGEVESWRVQGPKVESRNLSTRGS